jgi:hypothetical protein
MKKFFLFFALSWLLGCGSIPTSSDKNPTLLVGRVVYEGGNYVSNNGVSFLGKTTSGLEISLRNKADNRIFRISPRKNGMFYINLHEGIWWLEELYLKKERYDSAWSYISFNPAQKVFEIERVKVNNLGTIHWFFNDRRHSIIQADDSIAVKNEFSKQFSQSNWNQKDWKYNQLSIDFKRFSDERISYYRKSDDGKD